MHIGIDIRHLGRQRTGDEAVFLNLVKELVALDTENRYSLFLDQRTPEALNHLAKQLRLEGKKNFQLVSLPTWNRFAWNLFVLPQFLKRHPVDVYHTQYITPWRVPLATKIITHIHDVSFQVYPDLIGWKDRLFLAALIPPSLKRADKVIAVSEFTKQEIMRYYALPEEKIAVIPNALGEEFLAPFADPSAFAVARERYSLPKNYFLYVGTLQPRKNLPFLIEAFAQVTERLPEFSLVLGGDREGHHFDRQIDMTIAKHALEKKVLFPGYIDQADLPRVIEGARVFVLPSLYEGFGLPVLEAMSQNVPVVASDIPSLREVAEDAALFFSSDNLADLTRALYTAAIEEDLRRKLIAAGQERTHFFSWKKSAAQLLALYKQLV